MPLELSVKSLEILTDFFNIKYPLAKCDNLAVQRLDVCHFEEFFLGLFFSCSVYEGFLTNWHSKL